MSFRAVVVREEKNGDKHAGIENLELSDLPQNGVLIDVAYSTLNYKDGLTLSSGGGLVKSYPHVPGVDFSGTIAESDDPRFKIGDEVIVTGWRVGELYWGGFSQKARVNPDFLVHLPKGISLFQSMAIGTAGLTAMYALNTLEKYGLKPENGPVLVTGASGGVGSIAVALFAKAGYEICAVLSRPQSESYLRKLGATSFIPREELNSLSERFLESERWAACVDNVGGVMLARILAQMKYGGGVAAIGNVGGRELPATVIPFLLRGVNLLGIETVMRPHSDRIEAWEKMLELFPFEILEDVVSVRSLDDLLELGPAVLRGEVRGRTVIDVNT